MNIEEGFSYKKSGKSTELYCEGVSLKSIAKKFGTPTYIYSKSALLSRTERLQKSLPKNCSILFAVKSCPNVHILKTLSQIGCGADIVSGGELFRSILAGIHGKQVVFSGVGKSVDEISDAIAAKIFAFNVESVSELVLIDMISKRLRTTSRISLRINPNVHAKTHPYISTGLKKNKFGLSEKELREALAILPKLKNVKLEGLSCHIGSQIQTLKPLREAWSHIHEKAQLLRSHGHAIKHLNLGGGLGIGYGEKSSVTLEDYGSEIKKFFQDLPYTISIEPGRSLIGPTSVLLTSLLHTKERQDKNFYIIDAAMNDLIRPALYGSLHPFVSVTKNPSDKNIKATLVGPICESGDTFQDLAKVRRAIVGDLFVFTNTGAYGMSMASQYNSRPRAAEVLVSGSKTTLIRARESYSDLVRCEVF